MNGTQLQYTRGNRKGVMEKNMPSMGEGGQKDEGERSP